MDQKVDMLASTKRLQNRQQIKLRTKSRTILYSKQKDDNILKDKFVWLKKF